MINEYDDGYDSAASFERAESDNPSYEDAYPDGDEDERPSYPAHSYRVWVRSVPGFYEQYDGHVDVTCRPDPDNEGDEVFHAAVRKLKATSFPDRNVMMWKLERFERK